MEVNYRRIGGKRRSNLFGRILKERGLKIRVRLDLPWVSRK